MVTPDVFIFRMKTKVHLRYKAETRWGKRVVARQGAKYRRSCESVVRE